MAAAVGGIKRLGKDAAVLQYQAARRVHGFAHASGLGGDAAIDLAMLAVAQVVAAVRMRA